MGNYGPVLFVRVPITWRPRALSKWIISRVLSTLNGVTLIITLPITDLLGPLGLRALFYNSAASLWAPRKGP